MSVVIAAPLIQKWGLERDVEFPKFAFLGCLVPLPFRADGLDILDILASGVAADFRQPSRSAFQPQVRSGSRNTSLSPVEALR